MKVILTRIMIMICYMVIGRTDHWYPTFCIAAFVGSVLFVVYDELVKVQK